MIGVSSPLPPCCSSCGDEHPAESMQLYRFELICPTCYEDHEAKTERLRADEFQYQSREWFRWSHMERLPMMRNQFGRI